MKAPLTNRRIVSLRHLLALGACVSWGGHALGAATTPYPCSGNSTPAADLAKLGGNVSVTGTCFFTGDLVLDGNGTTSITTNAATFNLAGNLHCAGSRAISMVAVPSGRRHVIRNRYPWSVLVSNRMTINDPHILAR